MKRLHALAGLALLATGCMPVSNLTPAGYAEGKVAYNVHYADPATARRFVGPSWTLISHTTTGIPREEANTFHLDVDGDGRDDATRDLPRHDVRVVHNADGSRIGLRRFVFGRPQATEAHVWIRDLARSVSGTLWFDGGERRWTSRMQEELDLTVAGQKAVQLTVDIADADRLALSPGAIDHRMLVVVIDTPFEEFVGTPASGGLRSTGIAAPSPGHAAQGVSFPIRLLATYDAPPEVFESHLKEFEAFLASIEIGGKQGVVRPSTATPFPASSGVVAPLVVPTPPAAAPSATPAATSPASPELH